MGRDKGNKAELEVARLIAPWWQQLEPGALFIRTPLSGGWLSGRDSFDARGDLMVKGAPRFPWLLEVKRREAWSLQNVEDGLASPVWGWWRKACSDAIAAKRLPMLWARQNHGEWLVFLPPATRAPKPDLTWDCGAMRQRSVGQWSPVAYWADKLLASHPSKWIPSDRRL